MGDDRRLRVMMHPLMLSREIQPYIALLAEALSRRRIDVEQYRTVDAVLHPPDIIHFHWPEHVLIRPPVHKAYRALLVLTTLWIARMRGAVLVLTAHNASPHDHDLSRFDWWFLNTFDRLVDGVLVLSRAGWDEVAASRPRLRGAVVTHTRHGDFRSAYPAPSSAAIARQSLDLDPARPLVVFAGQVRAYKGVPELLEAAKDVDVDVLVAGACDDVALRGLLEEHARSDARIHLRLEHLTGSELTNVIAAASVVVLPYRKVLNSGSALLALSLERPVLVPPTPSFRELRDEVGSRWVMLCREELISASDLEGALSHLPDGSPNLEDYSWSPVAATTEDGYLATMAKRRRVNRG